MLSRSATVVRFARPLSRSCAGVDQTGSSSLPCVDAAFWPVARVSRPRESAVSRDALANDWRTDSTKRRRHQPRTVPLRSPPGRRSRTSASSFERSSLLLLESRKSIDEKIRRGWAYAGPRARKNCLTASSVTAAFVRGITQCLTVPVTSREPASRRRGCTRPPSRVIPCTRICWPVSQRQIGVVRRKEPVGIGAVRSKPIRGASGQIPKRSGESRS